MHFQGKYCNEKKTVVFVVSQSELFAISYRVLSRKQIMTEDNMMPLELLPLKGEENLKARPEKKSWVSFLLIWDFPTVYQQEE